MASENDTHPRKYTITLDTERGPCEAQVTEFLWDLGDGPEIGRWFSAPGWAFGHKSECIGEVNPGLSQSLDVSVSWTGNGSDTSVDVMIFGENDTDPADETLYEKTSISFQDPQDARQLAQLLLDAADRIEALPDATTIREFEPGAETQSAN